MDLNRRVTIPTIYRQLHRAGHIDALKIKQKSHCVKQWPFFWDSDLAKWIEVAAYALGEKRDAVLERKIDLLIDLMRQIQLPDGYFTLIVTSWRAELTDAGQI